MSAFDIDAYLARTGALDLWAIDWADVPRHPVPPEAIRTLRYMQDIESHTIVYLRSLLATRAIDDPDVARFLACWVYEESFHGLALERFLAAAGHAVGPRPKPHGHESPAQWLEARITALLSRAWPDFCAVHMAWGAINELTTLTGYRRLAAHHARRVAALLLLLSPGGDPAAAPGGGQSRPSSGRPLLGSRGKRGPTTERALFHGELSVRRRAGARGRPQGRRDHPQAAGLHDGATTRKLAGSLLQRRTEWQA